MVVGARQSFLNFSDKKLGFLEIEIIWSTNIKFSKAVNMTFSACQWLTTQLTGYVITWQNLQVLYTIFWSLFYTRVYWDVTKMI